MAFFYSSLTMLYQTGKLNHIKANKNQKQYLISCILSVINPTTIGPTMEEPLSVTANKEKKVDSLPFGISKENKDLLTVARPPIEIPYQTARKNISICDFKPIFSKKNPRIPYNGITEAHKMT
ncbi:hypothetical protein WICPIJ_007951 [Wickerhamomyces pijperi]|uniref:Uncharacterized protein n=1 Tax=Wickerhamomyces pijperi TaxID=599730 RepID=A0A9P8TJG2_WICPI|nr:hypothetical protein WICPIJ_007951 [Wickerhamomyces pijperi]